MLDKILKFLFRTHFGRFVLVLCLSGSALIFSGCWFTDCFVHHCAGCSGCAEEWDDVVNGFGIAICGDGTISNCFFGDGSCATCGEGGGHQHKPANEVSDSDSFEEPNEDAAFFKQPN